MEENNVKVKSKAKIIVVVLIAFLLLGAAVCASILLMPKNNVDNGEIVIKYDEKETAADEATLRALLAHDSNIIIEVTEDIMINQPITVEGGKRLTGDGTIAMELYVEPYQYMFVVDEDSKLELDGATIDGNGSSNCVKVEKNAQFSLMSGKLTYGCPMVIESFGNVYIKGGAIVDAIGTGVYAHSTGKVYMTAGSVRGCVDCGIEGAVDSYISVSEKAVLHDNMEFFIYSKGNCDITGGDFRDAQSDMVYTSGVMNVKYEGDKEGGMLKWHDIKGCALVVGNGGELNVDGLHVKEVGNRAVTTAAGESVTNISNSLFENTHGDSVYVRTEVNLTNVEIKNAGMSGIMLIQTGKAHVENVTVTGAKKDGIQCAGGIVTGSNFTANSVGRIGVNSYKYSDVAASVTLKNVTVNEAKYNGLHVETSTLTATDVKINGVEGEGARAQKAGKLNITNIEIKDAKGRNITSYDEGSKVVVKNAKTVGGQRGIAAFGGDVTATKVSIDSPTEYGVTGSIKSNVKVTDVTIKNSGKTAVNANDATITIDKATIDNPKATAGLNADYAGKITLKNADIKFAKDTEGNIDGVRAVGPATITLEKVDIVNAPRYGIYSNGKKAKVTVANVTTSGSKRGIQIYKGGQVEGDNVTIKSPAEYGVTCGDEGSGFNLKKLTVTGCGTTAVNVYDGAIGTVTNGTIKKAGALGGFVGNKAKLTLKQVVIAETTTDALMNSNATLNVTGGSIDKAGEDSVQAFGGGVTNLTDYKITNSTEQNIRVDNANTKCVLKNVQTTGGKRGIQIWSGATVEGEKVSITSPSEYGITCGDEGSAFNIKGLTVTESGKTALNVYDGAIAETSDVTITKPSAHAGFVGNKAKLTLNDITVSKTAMAALLNENSTLIVKDGTISDAGEHGVYTYKSGQTTLSDLKVKDSKNHNIRVDNANSKCTLTNVSTSGGERGVQIYSGGAVEGNTVTITSPTAYGIACGDENSSFNITGLTVRDTKSHAVNVYGKAKATVTNGTIDNPGINGVNVENADVTLNNVDIAYDEKTTGAYEGVKAYSAASITLNGVGIENAPEYGIQIWQGSSVSGNAVTITSPKASGIICGDAGSNFNITELNISESGLHGVDLYTSGSGTITGGTIEDAGEKGIHVRGGSSIALTDYEISNSIKENLYLHDASSATINGTLTTQGGTYALAIYGGSTVTKGDNYSEIEINAPDSHGVRIYDANSELNVGDMTLTGCGEHGIYMGGDKKPTVTLTGTVQINSVAKRGIQIDSGTLNAKNATVQITSSGLYGIAISGSGEIGKLEITDAGRLAGTGFCAAVQLNGSASLTINEGHIEDSYKHGINMNSTGTLKIRKCTIENSGRGSAGFLDIRKENTKATMDIDSTVIYSTGWNK